jgi:DnaJ-class molecular chaperone
MKDLYKSLGVAEDASEDEIKQAFRKLAKANHPDKTGGDKRKTERFKEINEAYAVLGDKQKRQEYDRLRRAPVGSDGMPMGFDPDAFAQVFGGGAGGFGRGGGGNVRVTTDFDGDVGDLFASLFGGGGASPFGRAGGRRATQRGDDQIGILELDFREAALGTRKEIQLGSAAGSAASIPIQVPPGADTGGRLRLRGKGGPPRQRGGEPGDLILELRVRPDPVLSRNDADIEMDLPLAMAEAILGGKVEVPTLEGSVHVTVPPGTSSGSRLRLRGRGVRRPDGTRGDQIMRVQIVVPKLSPDDAESRRLVEELATRTQTLPVRSF